MTVYSINPVCPNTNIHLWTQTMTPSGSFLVALAVWPLNPLICDISSHLVDALERGSFTILQFQ